MPLPANTPHSMRNSRLLAATLAACLTILSALPLGAQQYKRDITVAQDGSGDCTTIGAALRHVRAFMPYRTTIHIREGVYREKVVVGAELEHVDFIGDGADRTRIVWGDHAKIDSMGTFLTYTLKVDGRGMTFRGLAIENDAEPVAQAVALHTQGDSLVFIGCSLLGNQDTIYTGGRDADVAFVDCRIEGTTDFIFGQSNVLFERCTVHSRRDSYITAASTPEGGGPGYLFHRCTLTAAPEVGKVYLGRPWRPYAKTCFMECELGSHILPQGWDNWRDPANERTASYREYRNTGPGSPREGRAAWSRELRPREARALLKYPFFSDILRTHSK